MSSEGSREGRSSDSDLLVPSPSAATLHQISSLKDMLDQVNEENQQNIQKTREIESEIVIRDMSYNNISGEIPSGLPPSATFINLAANELVGNIPTSLPSLKNLKYLNVSNNSLFGVVGNAFTDMTRLEILDLSFNSFSGDLPSSFGSLKNLHSLLNLLFRKSPSNKSVCYLSRNWHLEHPHFIEVSLSSSHADIDTFFLRGQTTILIWVFLVPKVLGKHNLYPRKVSRN